MNSIYKKHENVFSITSTYYTYSYVWYYSLDSIYIIELNKGRVFNKKFFKTNILFDITYSNNENFELDSCFELDGDGLEYKIKSDDIIIDEAFPIGINCFISKEYDSDFFNKIKSDINIYILKEQPF